MLWGKFPQEEKVVCFLKSECLNFLFLLCRKNIMAYILEHAPKTVIIQILLNLPHEDLKSFCAINKRTREISGSKLGKEQYYKRHIFQVKSLTDAEKFLERDPIGLLHITKDNDFKQNELIQIGDRIIYLDLNNGVLYRNITQNCRFKNLKVLKLYHKDGELLVEKNYKDGRLDGLSKGWYRNGGLFKELNYRDGRQHGLSRMWHSNGQIGQEQNYKDGKKDGLIRSWHKN